VLLVLDATVGQNAHAQGRDLPRYGRRHRHRDDQARRHGKGGVLVSLAEKYGIPIHAIGIGEGAEDLARSKPRAYARSLVGLDV